MRRILFISAFTPAKTSAGQNYSLELLEDLASSARVDVIYFRYAGQDYTPNKDNIRVVKGLDISVLSRLARAFLFPVFHPLFTMRFSWSLVLQIRRLVRRNAYDLVYFDFSQVFLYSHFISHPVKMFMLHDVIIQKYTRQGNVLERWWVRLSEKFLISDKRLHLLVFSAKDASLVKSNYNREASVVNFYLSPYIKALAGGRSIFNNTFCLFGAWNRPENLQGLQWFLDKVVPFVRQDLEFKIIGGGMPKAISDKINTISRVSYTGFVENPYEVIGTCNALIAPLHHGAGVKVKVIESLACGTPVIGTDVALEGIPPEVSFGLYRSNTPSEFVAQLNTFSFTYVQRQRLRSWFQNSYPPQALNLIDKLVGNSP